MSIFSRNNKKDEVLTVLTEIKEGITDNTGFENELSNLKQDYTTEISNVNDKVQTVLKLADLHEKSITELENIVIKQNQQIEQMQRILSKYLDVLKLVLPREDEPTEEIEIKPTKRHYSQSIVKRKPHITKLLKNGYFRLKGGKQSKYHMDDILKLKKLLMETDLNFTQIAKKVNLSAWAVGYLGYAIETGDFDKYFKEWEQIQANQYYNKAKTQIRAENDSKGRF